MPKLGATELIIILLIVLLLFGANRLPQLGSSLGKAIRGFRSSMSAEKKPRAKSSKKNTTD